MSRKREYTTERITSDCQIRKSKTVLDCRFQATDSWLQGLDSRFLSVELGFRIPIVTRIPNSLSCFQILQKARIPDLQESISGFQVPQAKISGTPEFGFLYVGVKKFPAYCHNRFLMKLSIRRILICIVIIITICIIPGLRQLIPLNREKSFSQPLSALWHLNQPTLGGHWSTGLVIYRFQVPPWPPDWFVLGNPEFQLSAAKLIK